MKILRTLGLILIFGMATSINTAHAADSNLAICMVSDSHPQCSTQCKSYSKVHICGTGVYCDCSSCNNGHTPTEKTTQPGKYQSITYHTCPMDIIGPESCIAGYYGAYPNCTRCPEADNIYTDAARTTRARGTSAAGAINASECFLAPGTYYDASGQFTLESNLCTY